MTLLARLSPRLLAAKFFTSIQTRLLAVFLFNTLLTVVIVVSFNQWLRSQLIAEADNALLVNATQIANRIDEFNRSNKQVFNVGTRLPALTDFLLATDEERNDPDFLEQTRNTLDSFEIEPWDEYYILSQTLLDREGRIVLDTDPNNIGADESQQDYFRAAILGGSINISAVQYRPERSGIYFYYSVPLREPGFSLNIIGVLRVQVAVASVQDVVFDSIRGQGVDVVIFDEHYVRIVDTQHERLLFRSIETFSPEQIATLRSQYALPPLPDAELSLPMPDLVDALAETRQGQVISGHTAPHTDKEERLAIVKLETVPWYLVVSQPADQYFRPVQQQTRGILVLAIVLIVIALMSSYFISRRITKPIRTLTGVAEKVAEGALHIKAPVKSNDEVGTLAKTFNLMTTELEMARATLEKRVEERTQELSETNKKLTREIAERQRYEQQALELALEHERRRLLSEFIQKASHEFRTPLSIINVNSYLVKQLLPDEKHRHVTVIEEQGKYIEGLIDRMVLMSRLDSGVSMRLEYLQIDEFIKTLYVNWTSVFEKKNASAQVDLQAADAWIYADSELLLIAVQNILDNALKSSDEPVEISIKTCTRNGSALIIIEDNGPGIPQELHTRVFERFFRADEAHTTRGFGLGLPIAKLIIENLGGTIKLESEVGKGTTITMKLDAKTKEQI